MRTKSRHALWLAVVVILPLALSGCYRSIGGRIEPTPSSGVVLVSQQNTPLPQPTFTPMEVEPTLEVALSPSPSPFPTLAPPSDTPQPTLTWTRVPVDGQGGPVSTNTPVIVVIAPSFTPLPASTDTPVPTATTAPTSTALPTLPPLPTSTNTPAPTSTYTPVPSSTPMFVAVIPTFPPTHTLPPTSIILPTATFTSVPYQALAPSPTYTPFMPPAPVMDGQGGQTGAVPVLPTFTPSSGEAVPLAERPTETLAAPVAVAVLPTETPSPQGIAQVPTATLSEFQITATHIVYNATATAAALMGIQLPTFTPIPGQVVYATPLPPNVIIITATPQGQPGICGQYVIQVNDTLYRIAARYGVTMQQIAQANNITNPDLIKMGATLQIPCPVAATATPAPAQPVPQTGQGGLTTGNVYVVQSGDNIYQISLRFGVSMSELMATNGMDSTSAQMIYVGQELIIPASARVPTATPAPGQIIATPIYIIVTNTPGFSG